MDLMDFRRKIIMSSPHLSHAEGAVATFTDGTDLPLKSLLVNIDPVQDLRGQANPYPAGGSTNLLKSTPYGSAYNGAVGIDLKTVTTNVMDYSVQSDGKVAIDVTATWKGRLFATDALSAGTYSFRMWTGASNVRATWYVTDSDLVVTEMVNNQSSAGWGNVLTRTVTEGQRIALSLSSSTVATINTEFQVNTGSTIAPIVPFENICPISGWDAVGVHDTGINVWNEEWENGLISISNGQNVNGTGIRSKNMCPCAPNTTYYVKFGSGGSKYIFWYDKSGTFISYANTTGSRTETSPANARFFRIRNDVSTTYNHDISINYPSTDHDYHAYTGTSITIDLGQTVHGGTLNVLTGELEVEWLGIDGGSVTWEKASTYQYGKFFFSAPDSLFDNLGYNVISSAYKPESNNGASATDDMYVWVRSTHKIHVKDTNKENTMTADEFKTAMTGIMFVYKLANPITYHLDPQTVRSLVGQNNIFSDTGNVALEYWAHP